MPRYEIRKHNKMVCLVDVHLDKNENSFTLFNAPDAHWDNPKCDRELLKSHMTKAVKEGALIVMPGDTFCLMQGKYDPRGSKSDIRPEHNVANYLDAVIDDAAEWFKPYSKNMIVGRGNHESAILKRLETDVLERFCAKMGSVTGMGYQGWIILKIFYQGKHRATQNMYFHHGYGGGGPVTRGQINVSRQLMYVQGADLISNGHIHEKNMGETMVVFVENNGKSGYTAKAKSVISLISSTYKQEFTEGGFHIEKGRPPKPLGGVFVTFHVSRVGHEGSVGVVKEARFFSTQTFNI